MSDVEGSAAFTRLAQLNKDQGTGPRNIRERMRHAEGSAAFTRLALLSTDQGDESAPPISQGMRHAEGSAIVTRLALLSTDQGDESAHIRRGMRTLKDVQFSPAWHG